MGKEQVCLEITCQQPRLLPPTLCQCRRRRQHHHHHRHHHRCVLYCVYM